MSAKRLEYFEEVVSGSNFGTINNASGLDLHIDGVDKETVRRKIRQVSIDIKLPSIKEALNERDNTIAWENDTSNKTVETLLAINKFKQTSIAHMICALAKTYAPVDTGFMRDNIEVIVQEDIVAVVSFAEYSLYVHEAIDNHHNVGRAKFLEDATIDIYNTLKGSFEFEIQYSPLLLVVIHEKAEGDKSINKLITDRANELSSLWEEFGW